VDARGGSRVTRSPRNGGLVEDVPLDPERAASDVGGLVVWFRGGTLELVSTRPVTGLLGFGRGGPPGLAFSAPGRVPAASTSHSPFAPVLDRLPPGSRISVAYASLISAIRRVAARDAAGSSPVRSG